MRVYSRKSGGKRRAGKCSHFHFDSRCVSSGLMDLLST